MTHDDDDVLAANRAFYEAFSRGDADAMGRLWALEHVVACIHPGWDVLVGREAVLESWRAILSSPDRPRIRTSKEVAFVMGEVAFVTCIEEVRGSSLVATNVFMREASTWRMVHHHAGPVARGRTPRTASGSGAN